MKRDFIKYAIAGGGKCPSLMEMTPSEYLLLRDVAVTRDNGISLAVTMAYHAGFETGTRYESAKKRKK